MLRMISGYRVLRVADATVLDNIQAAVERIRGSLRR
jgi:hypothetical protein